MANLVNAVKSGDKRATLIALRDKVAEQIDKCESGRDMAALSKRLTEIMADIEALPDPEAQKVSKHDRLKSRNEKKVR